MMLGSNRVHLKGYLSFGKFTRTMYDTAKFTGRITVPVLNGDEVYESSFNIIAWKDVAESLYEFDTSNNKQKWLEITGTLQTRSYSGKCAACGEEDKKYWTDINVSSFVEIESEF